MEVFSYLMSSQPDGFLVAEMDHAIVGYLIALSRRRVGVIVSIATCPKYRRKGIGSMLMQTAMAYLITEKVDRVELQVDVNNAEAIAFYHDLSFKEVGRIPNYYADGADALIMEKRIPRMRGGRNHERLTATKPRV